LKHSLFGYHIAVIILLTLSLLATQLPFVHAAGVVTTCDEASLDAALVGGGTITFACSGTIIVTSTKIIAVNTTLDGGGQNVIISGGGTVQIFALNGGVSIDILNLTIVNGYSMYGGGAIMGDFVNVSNSTFSNNRADVGGAIAGLSVTVSSSTFTHNTAVSWGGALVSAMMTISDSTFSNNSAGTGGVIRTAVNSVISNSTFSNNSASSGGVIDNLGTLSIVGSTFVNNSTYGFPMRGAAIFDFMLPGSIVNISGSAFLNNDCLGNISDGGGNLVNNAPGCPGEYSDFSDLNLDPAPSQCQEMLDPAFAAPVGTYCQVLMRDGVWVGYPGTIPGELVDAGVIIAMEVIYYDLPGHAAQSFSEDGNQQVCLLGEGRFIYLDAAQSPRQIVEMNSVYEGGYTCAWIPHPGTVVLIQR
jgi:hypothetical protein